MKTLRYILELIECCGKNPYFKGTLIVSNKFQQNSILSVVNKIMAMFNHKHYCIASIGSGKPMINFFNGSHIDIIRIANNDDFRGKRAHYALVDKDIPRTIYGTRILPMIKNYEWQPIIAPAICDFNNLLEDFDKYQEDINMTATTASATIFAQAFWDCKANKYDEPFKTFEKDCKKHLLYKIPGIYELTYTKEFVNKTKETFLNIKGEREIPELEYKNSVDIHLKIDTDLYNSYEVHHTEGILVVTLHEIINAEPTFEEYNPF